MKRSCSRKYSLLPLAALVAAACGSSQLSAPAAAPTSGSAGARASAPLSGVEKYGKLPAVSRVAISPNGKYFAYRRVEGDKDAVLVYSLEERKLVNGVDVASIDPHRVYFASDDILILVVSEFKDLMRFRGASDISTAFTYSFKEGKLKALMSPGQGLARGASIYPNQTGMGRVLGLSADSRSVYMPAFVREDIGDRSPNYSLLEVPADGSGRPKIVEPGTPDTVDYFLDNQGNALARESYNKQRHVHLLESKVSGEWKKIYELETELPQFTFVGLAGDSKSLLFSAVEEERDFRVYYSMNLQNGEIKGLPYQRPGKDVAGLVRDHNNAARGVRYSGLVPSYQFFDGKLQERFEAIQSTFPEHSVELVDWSEGFGDLLVHVEGSSVVGDYLLFSENRKPRLIASARPDIEVEEMGVLGRVTYKARDGLAVPTLLTIPRDKVDALRGLPAVVMPHGGPAAHDTIGFDFLAQALASRGYLVVQPQFRGSTGFGLEHKRAGYGQWGKKMQDDLTDAVEFLKRKGMVDPDRICIVGASYGGYAALAGAAFTPDLYKCAAALAGVSHVPEMLSFDRSLYGDDSTVLSYFKMAIGGGEFNEEELKAISPYFFAKDVRAPVLLVHGEDDKIVEFKQSELMLSALQEAGGEVELVKLDNEDHHLQDQPTRVQAVKALVEFVDKHIGQPATPPGEPSSRPATAALPN